MKKKLRVLLASVLTVAMAVCCFAFFGCGSVSVEENMETVYVQLSEVTPVMEFGGQTIQYANTKNLTTYKDGTYMMYSSSMMILNGGNGGMYYNVGFGTFTKESTDPSDPDCTTFKITLSEPTRIISYNGYPWGNIPNTNLPAGYWDSADDTTYYTKEDENGNTVKYTYEEQLKLARSNMGIGADCTYGAEVTVTEEKYDTGLPKGYMITEYKMNIPEKPAPETPAE